MGIFHSLPRPAQIFRRKKFENYWKKFSTRFRELLFLRPERSDWTKSLAGMSHRERDANVRISVFGDGCAWPVCGPIRGRKKVTSELVGPVFWSEERGCGCGALRENSHRLAELVQASSNRFRLCAPWPKRPLPNQPLAQPLVPRPPTPPPNLLPTPHATFPRLRIAPSALYATPPRAPDNEFLASVLANHVTLPSTEKFSVFDLGKHGAASRGLPSELVFY